MYKTNSNKRTNPQTPTAVGLPANKRRRRPANSASGGHPLWADKRPRDVFGFASWGDLRPELIGHVARYLPMDTPDMMRLLLCVGPATAAVIRKMYLSGNDYYLWHCMSKDDDERIVCWMQYNEKEWKRRCLGKSNKENVHSIALTPEHAKLTIQCSSDIFDCNHIVLKDLQDIPNLDGGSREDTMRLAKNRSGRLLVLSVAGEDVDNGLTTMDLVNSLIDAADLDDDGKINLCIMRETDAFFAYPRYFIDFDLVDVLRFMVEDKLIDPKIPLLDKIKMNETNYMQRSLLCNAIDSHSFDCFQYLLSLPDVGISSIAYSVHDDQGDIIDRGKAIHTFLLSDVVPPEFLAEIIDCHGVDVDATDFTGSTALLLLCERNDIGESEDENEFGPATFQKVRMLLEAGADPRIDNEDAENPVFFIFQYIEKLEGEGQRKELKKKLKDLAGELLWRMDELDELEEDEEEDVDDEEDY